MQIIKSILLAAGPTAIYGGDIMGTNGWIRRIVTEAEHEKQKEREKEQAEKAEREYQEYKKHPLSPPRRDRCNSEPHLKLSLYNQLCNTHDLSEDITLSDQEVLDVHQRGVCDFFIRSMIIDDSHTVLQVLEKCNGLSFTWSVGFLKKEFDTGSMFKNPEGIIGTHDRLVTKDNINRRNANGELIALHAPIWHCYVDDFGNTQRVGMSQIIGVDESIDGSLQIQVAYPNQDSYPNVNTDEVFFSQPWVEFEYAGVDEVFGRDLWVKQVLSGEPLQTYFLEFDIHVLESTLSNLNQPRMLFTDLMFLTERKVVKYASESFQITFVERQKLVNKIISMDEEELYFSVVQGELGRANKYNCASFIKHLVEQAVPEFKLTYNYKQAEDEGRKFYKYVTSNVRLTHASRNGVDIIENE